MELTSNEYAVMSAIWSAGEPLTSHQILDRTPSNKFKDRTVHTLIISLIEKGAVVEVDRVKTSQYKYSRRFDATISFDDYHSKVSVHSTGTLTIEKAAFWQQSL